MRIAVVAANGRAGQLITKEAVDRGLDVTAVVRGENRSVAPKAIVKDLFDLTAEDLAGFDVVIDAFGAWTADTLPQLPESGKHLADLLAGTDTRLIIVGGAGSLYVDPERTTKVEQGPDFPDSFKPLSAAHGQLLAALRTYDNVNWTYVSPAGDFQADGERTGEYQLSNDILVLNSKGQSVVSYADYAIAIVDEALNTTPHLREQISVCSK